MYASHKVHAMLEVFCFPACTFSCWGTLRMTTAVILSHRYLTSLIPTLVFVLATTRRSCPICSRHMQQPLYSAKLRVYPSSFLRAYVLFFFFLLQCIASYLLTRRKREESRYWRGFLLIHRKKYIYILLWSNSILYSCIGNSPRSW